MSMARCHVRHYDRRLGGGLSASFPSSISGFHLGRVGNDDGGRADLFPGAGFAFDFHKKYEYMCVIDHAGGFE